MKILPVYYFTQNKQLKADILNKWYNQWFCTIVRIWDEDEMMKMMMKMGMMIMSENDDDDGALAKVVVCVCGLKVCRRRE